MTQIGEIQFTVRFADGTTKQMAIAEITKLECSYEILDSRGNVLMKNS